MIAKLSQLTLFFCLLLALMACRSSETPAMPTLVPTAQLPNQSGSTLNLPPTSDLSQRNTPVATPTRPTATPRPTGTPVTPIISITAPETGAEIILGSEIRVGGLLQIRPGQRVVAALVSATGYQLALSDGVVEENGWRATLLVPENVTGLGQVQAAILDPDGSVAAISARDVKLALDTTRTTSYLVISRPGLGDIAVADHNLFFDGTLQRYGGGFLRLSIWTEDCQTKVAEHGFSMRGSSYWQGFVVIPRDVLGPACAIASIGTPGDPNWREAQVPITIMAKGDEEAVGVLIASPLNGQTVLSGETILIYGTAYNAPDGEIFLSVLLNNGRIITETIIEPDTWGYWEQSIVLPFDVSGQAIITAGLGDPADPLVSTNVVVEIDQGPTPTPGLPPTIITTPTASATPDGTTTPSATPSATPGATATPSPTATPG